MKIALIRTNIDPATPCRRWRWESWPRDQALIRKSPNKPGFPHYGREVAILRDHGMRP